MKTQFKYYQGEKECPPEFLNKTSRKFWYGESMFENTKQPLDVWVDNAKAVLVKLEKVDKVKFDQASKYTIEQFAVILYIEELFTKWNPYDNMKWIFEY
ncbi:MAG: hypothetical protein EOM44_09690 [Bacteroidia bacterium]|nr:hypothetical protein [Bacteroidia bacterium]